MACSPASERPSARAAALADGGAAAGAGCSLLAATPGSRRCSRGPAPTAILGEILAAHLSSRFAVAAG
jgi:hypothetical protein